MSDCRHCEGLSRSRLLHRAAALNGPTDIALTFSDYITASNRDARRFEQLSEPTIHLIA